MREVVGVGSLFDRHRLLVVRSESRLFIDETLILHTYTTIRYGQAIPHKLIIITILPLASYVMHTRQSSSS
jgi:hypothetical protein